MGSRRVLVSFSIAGALVAAGCNPSAPVTKCVPMSGPSALVTGAKLLRLDVYGANVICAGNIAPPNAGAPQQSRSFKPGDKIVLDVPPGAHTLVLSTFSDAAGNIPLGSACATATLQPGAQFCEDLTVGPAPDLSAAVVDAAADLEPCLGAQCVCANDGDCRDPARPRCSPGSVCVPCLPASDNCPADQYCTSGFQCTSGCKANSDCDGAAGDGGASDGGAAGAMPFCNTTRHSCVQCLSASDCPTGELCSPSGACVQGCDLSMGKGCPGSLACCNKLCVDTRSDVFNCSQCGMQCTGANTQCCNSVCSNPNSDVVNCGGCGKPCSTLNATPHCGAGGVCSWTCSATFAHCQAGNTGCETAITTASNCGGCGTVCQQAGGTNACTFNGASGGCVPTCDSTHGNCDGLPNNGCELALTTTANCGGCGIVCQQAGGTNSCSFNGSTGGCVPACDSLHGDCDASRTNGCETTVNTAANCRSCGAVCQAVGGTNSCTWNGATGGCIPSCDGTHGNCDGLPNNGCETDITTSLSHCGGCARPCSNTNVGTPACSGGLCTSTCVSTSFGNCSTPAYPTADNGCESNLNTDANNCGQCARACSTFNTSGTSCAAGLCNSACSGVNANCSQPPAPTSDNGCECVGNGCCGTGCQTAHSVGYPTGSPATYYDCVTALGTPGTPNGASCTPGTLAGSGYTQAMADDAANQFAGQAGTIFDGVTCTIGAGNVVTVTCKTVDATFTTGTCTCWAWSATGNQTYAIGHVYQSSGGAGDAGCFCPTCVANRWN